MQSAIMARRCAGGGGLLAGTRRRPAAEDGVPPSLQIPPQSHILLARSPAPYSPFRRRAHSPTAFSGPMARPPPASSSLTHARRMDGFCNQNADQLGSLAGLSLPAVYVGVVECAPASPYTYSSSTHRFPHERTPIEATPLSATSAVLVLGLGLGLGLVHTPPRTLHHTLLFFLPPSFHTISRSLAFTSA